MTSGGDPDDGGLEVLDAARLGRLAAMGPSGVNLLRELVDLALTDTPGRIDRLRASVTSGDLAAAAAIAHALRARAGMLGGRRVEALCDRIEHGREADAVERDAEALGREWESLAARLRAERDRR